MRVLAGRPETRRGSQRRVDEGGRYLGIPPERGFLTRRERVNDDHRVSLGVQEIGCGTAEAKAYIAKSQTGPYRVAGRIYERDGQFVYIIGRAFKDGDSQAPGNLLQETSILVPVIQNRTGTSAPGAYFVGDLCFSGERIQGINGFGGRGVIWRYEECLSR